MRYRLSAAWRRLPLPARLVLPLLPLEVVLLGLTGAHARSGGDVLLAAATVLLLDLLVWLVAREQLRHVVDYVEARAVALAGGPTIDHGRPARELDELAASLDLLAVAVEEREATLESTILQLQELEQVKTDFVSTVSHELRTPLTAIRGSLGLVTGGALGAVPPRQLDLLRIAQQNADRLIRLVNDMLDVQKIEEGMLVLRRERCDLAALVRATATSLEPMALDAGVRLELHDASPLFCTGDPDRLTQLFTNLVSNAIKYAPRDSVVELSLALDGEVARIAVRDHGPGVPPEFIPFLFGRFRQAECGDAKQKPGTGLGLSIARGIAGLHEGTIAHETPADGGARFVVEIPGASRPAVVPARSPDRWTILVADDDPVMVRVLQERCSPFAEVIAAHSASEVELILGETAIDGAIVEPMVAGADGLALVRRLHEGHGDGDVPVMILSSVEHEPGALVAAGHSPQHCFVKSRDREADVVLRLRAALAVRRPHGAPLLAA